MGNWGAAPHDAVPSGLRRGKLEKMTTTDQKPTPPRRRIPTLVIFLLLAAIPSGYFYVTGRLARTALQREIDGLVQKSEALADSLDGVRTHLILGAAQASVGKGDFDSAQPFISDFFDRVDRRTRKPGTGAVETATRMDLLSSRDDAIRALSQKSSEARRILDGLATLHLGLADPGLKARIPTPAPGAGIQDSLRTPPATTPGRYPPRATLPQ